MAKTKTAKRKAPALNHPRRRTPVEKKAPAKVTHPRQETLPGMEDRKLKDIHDAALDYIDARDTRIAATAPEVQAKTTLLGAMKKHKLEHYKCADVEVNVVHEKETVKAKLISDDDDESTPRKRTRVDGKARAANDDSMPTQPEEQREAVEEQ